MTTRSGNSQPSPKELLEHIATLVQSLDRVVARTAGGVTTSGGTPPPPTPGGDEKARRQAIARLRYDIVTGLLGRTGFEAPFAPARRGEETNRIVFEPALPDQVAFVTLRSAGADGRTETVFTFEPGDGITVIDTGQVAEAPLQPIELYDGASQLIRLGPNLPARPQSVLD